MLIIKTIFSLEKYNKKSFILNFKLRNNMNTVKRLKLGQTDKKRSNDHHHHTTTKEEEKEEEKKKEERKKEKKTRKKRRKKKEKRKRSIWS